MFRVFVSQNTEAIAAEHDTVSIIFAVTRQIHRRISSSGYNQEQS
jgi:hypothetical protein